MTDRHPYTLCLASTLALSALTGCGRENPDAHFHAEHVLIEVGSTYDLSVLDVSEVGALRISVAEPMYASLVTESNLFFDAKHVVRVESAMVGTTRIRLYDGDTLIDTVTVEVAPVARLDVVADDALYGPGLEGAYGVLTGTDVVLHVVARDALGRTFDGHAPRSLMIDEGFDVVFGWDDIYSFRASEAGTHAFTLEGDMRETQASSLTAVVVADVSALRITVSERNEETCVSVVGLTDALLPILGVEPVFGVDGAPSGLDAAFGVMCFETAPPPGTVVSAGWNGLGVTRTF
jgi:hypothetical protein